VVFDVFDGGGGYWLDMVKNETYLCGFMVYDYDIFVFFDRWILGATCAS
jgi:hypothetical protein